MDRFPPPAVWPPRPEDRLRIEPQQRLGRRLALALLPAAIAGCAAVGPDFHAPAAPDVPTGHPYTATALPDHTEAAPTTGGAAQLLVAGKDIPSQWWTLFRSPALDELVRSAIERSPTVAAAQAALRQAQENYNAQYGSTRLPSVTAGAQAERERASVGAFPPSVFNLYGASVNVSYTIDAFGGVRRGLESLQAAIDYQRYQIEAAYLALTANLVTTAIQEASLRAQLQATRQVLEVQKQSLELLEKQLDLGAITLPQVLQQRTLVAQTRATLPPLEKSLAQTRNQLAIYAGRLPGEGGLPQFELSSLRLPDTLPVSVPSDLVRQRPDIQASEALLHQASAQVGVATANLYPQINLTGAFGVGSSEARTLFDRGNLLWNLTAGLTAPVFNGGSLQAKRRAAVAAYDQSLAQYRSTLLNAFQNVANALHALDSDALSLREQADAARLAQESLDLTRNQFRIGSVNYLSLLSAQQTYQQTQISLAQAQAARYADTAALFQALGGGWWNRGPLADARIDTPSMPPADKQP